MLFEDYFLWARMLMNGAIFHTIQEPLLLFRMDKNTFKRRRGINYARNEIRLQREFRKMGFINQYEYIRNLILRVPPRLLSSRLLKVFYKYILR